MPEVNPLVYAGGEVPGFISSRLMAAYRLDDEHTIHVNVHSYPFSGSPDGGRTTWHYVLEHNGNVIFEGTDYSTWPVTYGDAARGVLGFLTLRPGDTDAEFFDSYTPEQIAWRDEHAEDLSIFALDPD